MQEELGPAVVIGASGGIGAALVAGLQARGVDVSGYSRSQDGLDLTDEASIAAMAQGLAAAPGLVIVATGALTVDGHGPEKAMAALHPDLLARQFALNAVGPALVAKHFLPLQPRRGRTVFAALSARVGSISDNQLGGWHGYRASKAALNQLIRTLAIEQARRNPAAIVAALHPGTVNTPLSRPFQRTVAAERLFTPAEAAAKLLDVIAGLRPVDSGRLWGWDGQEIAP